MIGRLVDPGSYCAPMSVLPAIDQVLTETFQTLPLVGLYAEIHYRFPIRFSRYFRRIPEILFDLPWRCQPGQTPSLFLLVKDAQRFPVRLGTVRIELQGPDDQALELVVPLDKDLSDRLWTMEIPLDNLHGKTGIWRIKPLLDYQVGKRVHTLAIDNYPQLKKEPLRIQLSATPLPTPAGWLRGEMHYHSSLTDDQVEFGAPLSMSQRGGTITGLDFLNVTDHSYDLDDRPENYLENDPDLVKWHTSRRQMAELNAVGTCQLLPGEEISIRNHRGRTVHMLHSLDPTYYPGSGDGADAWPRIRCELAIPEVLSQAPATSFTIAAHNGYGSPWLHRLLLGRDIWYAKDLAQPGLHGAQILSGTPSHPDYRRSKDTWIAALLNGRRLAAIGGSDAHGNFNRFRQVKLPMWSLMQHDDQVLGQVQTLVHSDVNTPEAISRAIRQRATAVSSGPAGNLLVTCQGKKAGIGETLSVPSDSEVQVAITGLSTAEFGLLESGRLIRGDLVRESESVIAEFSPGQFQHSESITLTINTPCYLRLEWETPGGLWPGVYVSSPVWITFNENPRTR